MKKIFLNLHWLQKYKRYLVGLGMIALFLGCQIFPLLITPIIAPSTAIVHAAVEPLETLSDFLSLGKNTVEELQEAIRIAGGETRKTLEKLKNDLLDLIDELETTYQDNLNITLDSLDNATKINILRIEDLVTKVNGQIQADIKFASQEAQTVITTASQEINSLSLELKQRLEEVIIVGGETSVYLIERSIYNSILLISLVFLGVGLLLFIWLFFSRRRPRGVGGVLVFFFIALYLGSFSGLAFVPNFRGQVMAYTGVGLEERLQKVKSQPRIFQLLPDKIVLKKTRELEIWGNTLLLNNQPPMAKVAGINVPVKAFSNEKIVLDVAKLNAPEGSANLDLTYDNGQNILAIVSLGVPYIPPKPADLTITNFTVSPSTPLQSGNVKATISVKNTGESEANNFILEWKPVANSPGKTTRINSLKPGKSIDVSLNSSYTNVGTFDMVAIVDSNNTVSETDEANNSRTRQITVKQAPPRRANVEVYFTRIIIKDDADPAGSGEIKLDFTVNGQTWGWSHGANSGRSYNLDKKFQMTLKESENLKIYINGIDKDAPGFPTYDDHDPMGVVNKEFVSHKQWGEGNHFTQSTCPDGCYTVYYTISVNWLD